METGLSVLTAFIGAEPMPMLKTLSERTGMHPAKVHRYLVSLCRAGYVEQDDYTGRYRLGHAALRLGFAALDSIDVARVARPVLQQLSADLHLSAVLALWGNNGPVVALQEFFTAPVGIIARVGTVLPMLGSSTGRMFGAFLPRAKTQALLRKELAARRQQGAPGRARTMEEVEDVFRQIRERRLSRATGELNPAIYSLSAPVFDGSREVVAVLSVIGAAGGIDQSWDGPTSLAVRAAAESLSAALGYVPGS